jgi:hypothetical protein
MNAKVIFLAIVVIITTNIFSVSSQSSSNVFFDKKYENEKVVSSTKYELGYSGLHEKTYLTNYAYDEWGRLQKKEAFKWDSEKSVWLPNYYIEYNYDFLTNSQLLEFAAWNEKENKFDPVSESLIYQLDFSGTVTSAVFVKMNSTNNQMEESTLFNSNTNMYLAM